MLCLYGRSEPTRKRITFPTTYIPNGEVGNHIVDGRVVDFEYISPCANPILVVGLENVFVGRPTFNGCVIVEGEGRFEITTS